MLNIYIFLGGGKKLNGGGLETLILIVLGSEIYLWPFFSGAEAWEPKKRVLHLLKIGRVPDVPLLILL